MKKRLVILALALVMIVTPVFAIGGVAEDDTVGVGLNLGTNTGVALRFGLGDFDILSKPDGMNLAKLASLYSDGIIMASEDIPEELKGFCEGLGREILPYFRIEDGDNGYIDTYNDFYDRILNGQK